MVCPVSVIIPCYRCAATIDRAVGSVAGQTQLPAEIMLVEDCSADGGKTLAALEHLRERYRGILNIKIIAMEQNGGPGRARNAGWEAASQPYIAFLDADDSWNPRKLELQYGWMSEHPQVVLTGHRSEKIAPESQFPELTDEVVAHAVSRRKFLLSNSIPTRSVMLRREHISYRFDPAKRHSEDYLLWLQIVLIGNAVWQFDAPLAYSYKADYGEEGLSADLWKMEKGELDTYIRVWRERLISFPVLSALWAYSLSKYLRRMVLVFLRRR